MCVPRSWSFVLVFIVFVLGMGGDRAWGTPHEAAAVKPWFALGRAARCAVPASWLRYHLGDGSRGRGRQDSPALLLPVASGVRNEHCLRANAKDTVSLSREDRVATGRHAVTYARLCPGAAAAQHTSGRSTSMQHVCSFALRRKERPASPWTRPSGWLNKQRTTTTAEHILQKQSDR